MGKKINLEARIIKGIILDSKTESIRHLAEKYKINKNVVLRVIKENINNNTDTLFLICKKTNKKIFDIYNKSGSISKHLKKIGIFYNKKTYLSHFIEIKEDKYIVSFIHYINSLRLKFIKKTIIEGLTKITFYKENLTIIFINNKIISLNKKIKPILLSKLKDRYENSLFIYLDEWLYKSHIIKSKIEYSLKLNLKEKIYARSCLIKTIDTKTKNSFLEKNHIQGGCKSTINYGSYFNNQLIAVMCLSKYNPLANNRQLNYDYELVRFSTDINYHVVGICSKMLSFFDKEKGKSVILSYGDRRFLLNKKNNIYNTLNFNYSGFSDHDYYYLDNDLIGRKYKFGIQIRNKIKGDNYDISFIKKIWDCGKYKFIRK